MRTTLEERMAVLKVTPALIKHGHKSGTWENDFVLRLTLDVEYLLGLTEQATEPEKTTIQ